MYTYIYMHYIHSSIGSTSATGQFIFKKKKSIYVKHFTINIVHINLGFFNSKTFLRKSQFFCISLTGIVFPLTVFTT